MAESAFLDRPQADGRISSNRATAFLIAYFALFIGGFAIIRALAPGYLLQPVNPNLIAGAVFLGVMAFLLLAGWSVQRGLAAGRLPSAKTAGGLLVFGALIGFKLPIAAAGVAVQGASFVGARSPVRTETLTVSGSHYDWWAKRGGFYIELQVPGSSSTLSLPATHDAYDAVKTGDRVDLPVQTGRFGIARALPSGTLTTADLHAPPG